MTISNNGRKRQFYSISTIACEWLCDLKLENSESKNVLQALVLHADAEGVCFPSIDRLANITDLHTATVRRRLVLLESLGLISREPQWIDANGMRIGERRGKQTSDKIRLLFPTGSPGQNRAESHTIGSPVASPEHHTEHHHGAAESISQRPALAQDSHSGKGLINEQEKEREESPPTPPLGGSQDDLSWERFKRVWGEPIPKPSLVEPIWSALTLGNRALALKAAAGYWVWRKSQRWSPTTIGAKTFLRESDGWSQWLPYAPALLKADPFVVELENSPGWRTRCTIAKIAGKQPPVAVELPQGRGNRLPPLPPEYLELGKYADEDPETWKFLDHTDARCIAWCSFLRIEARLFRFGTKEHYHNGRHYPDWPVKRTGLRVPCPWPPGYLDLVPPL